jgi:hypothetical protein
MPMRRRAFNSDPPEALLPLVAPVRLLIPPVGMKSRR